MTKRLPTSWIVALFGIALAASFALAVTHTVPFSTRTFLYDFRASLCAGEALNQGSDPYRTEPLHTCEHRFALFRADLKNLTAPAPLPGYELEPFALLARLPYPLASSLWVAASTLALAVAGFSLTRLTTLPASVVWSLILLPACLSIFLGQLALVALAALVASALFMQRRQYRLAAIAAAVMAVEPHVAMPALLSLALFVPRSRLTLAACIVLGAVVSLTVLGIHGNLEFLRTVLPAQTASEIANEEQYSFAYALHQLGLSDTSALAYANLSFGVTVVLGIWAARALVSRGAPETMYVLLPPAFAILGGPYVHIHHMVFAIPAAAVLYGRGIVKTPYLALALIALAIPWGAFVPLLPLLPVVAVVIFALGTELLKLRTVPAAIVSLAASTCIVLLALGLTARPEVYAALAPFTDGTALPEFAWKAYIDAAYHSNIVDFALSKIPTIAGLLVLVGAACGVAFGPPRSRLTA